jgi:hypothetical protein
MTLVLLTTSTDQTRRIQAVRNAINERAKSLQVSDDKRHQAVSKAMTMMKLGSSPAWSVAEACRLLVGKVRA